MVSVRDIVGDPGRKPDQDPQRQRALAKQMEKRRDDFKAKQKPK